MPDPWDPFPMPSRGEPVEFSLYYGMGKVIDCWERVEFGLSQLYSLFLGDRSFMSMTEYGRTGNIFRDRIAGLGRAADEHFRRSPHQAAEGGLDRLIAAAKGFSDRRNEVAHAIVMDVQTVLFFQHNMTQAAQGVPQFLVIPPVYHVRKMDANGLPAFAYSTVELNVLGDRMFNLEVAIDDYIRECWPGALPPRLVEP